MKEILLNLFDNINYTEEEYEIVQLVDNFDVSNLKIEEFNELLKIIDQNYENIDYNLFPVFVEALYSSNNVKKFKIGCYLLAKYGNKMKYIPRLEDYNLVKNKFKTFLPTLLYVAKEADNDLFECMITILRDNMDKYDFTHEDIGTIIHVIADKLELIITVLKKYNNEIDRQTTRLVLLLLEIARKFSNDRIHRIVKDCTMIKNDEILLASIKLLMENDRIVPEEQLIKAIKSLNICTRLFRFMHKQDKLEYFPMKLLNQEYIARINFIEWLENKNNLGKSPVEIELIDELEDVYNIYYAYKFKLENDGRWIIGVSGGYDKYDVPTLATNGLTGTLFDTYISFEFLNQVKNILDDCEKKKVNNMKNDKVS